MANGITNAGVEKGSRPTKPYPEYPLIPHASGSWVMKIRGRRWTFGGWKNAPQGEAALVEYHRQRAHIEKYGERPPADVTPDEAAEQVEESQKCWLWLTIYWLVNAVLDELTRKI